MNHYEISLVHSKNNQPILSATMDFFDQNAWEEQPQSNVEQGNLSYYNTSRMGPVELQPGGQSRGHLRGHLEEGPGNLMEPTSQPVDRSGEAIIPIDIGAYDGSFHSYNMRDSTVSSINDSLPGSMNDQYFSPALSFQVTPLTSPHALAPQPTSSSAFHQRYQPHSASKVTKPSPSQWRSGSINELDDLGDFELGDPAMSVYDPLTQPSASTQEDIDDKLEAAITATTNATSSNRSSMSYTGSSRHHSNASSRHGSRSTTPRILPKVNLGAIEVSPKSLDLNETFSRSNYQNLVDGKHQHLGLPGADRIVTNLKAKKAVHKIAEKERRNRMNQAIIELSAVLGPVSDPNNITTSKAATVERATAYIQQLHSKIAELEKCVGDKKN